MMMRRPSVRLLAPPALARLVARCSTSTQPPLLLKDDLVDGAPNGVKILTLNTPSKLNPMTVELGEAIAETVESLSAEPASALRAVVLTGAGRAFSAGGDLAFLQARRDDTPASNAQQMRDFYARYLSIRRLPVPVVACINGPAIGAGLSLALAADLRTTWDGAKLGLTFVGLGLHPGMGCTHTLLAATGSQVASAMLLSGQVICGAEAQRLGLVLRSLPDADAAMCEALVLARHIAAQGPLAVRATVRTLRASVDVGLERALQREADAQAHSYASKEYSRGLEAIIAQSQRKGQS